MSVCKHDVVTTNGGPCEQCYVELQAENEQLKQTIEQMRPKTTFVEATHVKQIVSELKLQIAVIEEDRDKLKVMAQLMLGDVIASLQSLRERFK